MSDMQTIFHRNNENLLIVENKQDCEPIAEICARLRKEGKTGTSEMYLVGTIPDVIVEKYCIEHGISNHEFCIDRTHIKRIMNNPDYAKFRVWEGQI